MPIHNNAVRVARKRKGLTQQELARRAGTTQVNISELETGANGNPSWALVGRVARALGVEPSRLIPLPRAPRRQQVEADVEAAS